MTVKCLSTAKARDRNDKNGDDEFRHSETTGEMGGAPLRYLYTFTAEECVGDENWIQIGKNNWICLESFQFYL